MFQNYPSIHAVCDDPVPYYTVIGNINNFNVIYLLSEGGPAAMDYYNGTGGKTDLLVTWLYKLTIDFKDYNYGAVIGDTYLCHLCNAGARYIQKDGII